MTTLVPYKKKESLKITIGSLYSYNFGIKYLLCVIDVFTKYAGVKPLNDKKSKTVIYGFITKESKRKPNKLWVNQEREFYNSRMQK